MFFWNLPHLMPKLCQKRKTDKVTQYEQYKSMSVRWIQEKAKLKVWYAIGSLSIYYTWDKNYSFTWVQWIEIGVTLMILDHKWQLLSWKILAIICGIMAIILSIMAKISFHMP